MGSIFTRGPRHKVKYYAAYKDVGGVRRSRLLPGARTLAEARDQLAVIMANVAKGHLGIPAAPRAGEVRELFEQWFETLTNRSKKKDIGRARLHLLPHFGPMAVTTAQQPSTVLLWMDAQRRKGASDAVLGGCLVLLSRLWGWAISRRLATMNPIAMLPRGDRPKRPRSDGAWLETDAQVVAALEALEPPFRQALWFANRCGLRTGECAGLRISDVAWAHGGRLRVRGQWSGQPLKEDRRGGLVKWAPCPADFAIWVRPYLEQRLATGAQPEDILLHYPPSGNRPRRDASWQGLTQDSIKKAWNTARLALGLPKGFDFYTAGRHSFASRLRAASVPIDQISQAMNHSSVVVTAGYIHGAPPAFSPALLRPLQPEVPTAQPQTPTNPDSLDSPAVDTLAQLPGREPE
jgi:integrase